ncbi:Transmembrane protein [Trema orientale]|uniref:Transmembrane protein n=1 Tax=Trema orientale TaxID=63057 RepID=A0A2P5EB88_TREOI|nr:Transmembrane protein [Trema orientale]
MWSVSSSAVHMTGNQVFPVDYEAEVSQRLVDVVHSSSGITTASTTREDIVKSSGLYELIADPFVDVNFVGTVSFQCKKSEIVLLGELAHEVRVECEEFKTGVTALFLAAHSGNLPLVRKLLGVGANVNQRVFRGYPTTAAVREGHLQILEVLITCGASQQACEEALLEASYLGRARHAEMLMASEMIRSQAAVHALVSACCRGFVDVVYALLKCGVDANATDRLLLQSSKPFLHANLNCCALVAAIVSRQINVVRLLLQAGVRTDIKVNLGAWSWDMDTGEDFRVGAGLAEAYSVTWCAVEYFEASGAILSMLLQHLSPNTPHLGRTLIHHAILCNNVKAVEVLLNCGADVEAPTMTTSKIDLRPIHLAARLGSPQILQHLIKAGCNVNSVTGHGDTALMICARYKREECLKILAAAGADFGLVNSTGLSTGSIAESTKWTLGFQQAVLDVIRNGVVVQSTNKAIFSPLMFVTRANDNESLKKLIEKADIDLDEQDENGFSAAMIASAAGELEAFRLLVYAGADMKLRNKHGETALKLSEANQNSLEFEKLMLKHSLETTHKSPCRFYSLHQAARRGDFDYVRVLASKGCDVNAIDDDNGYTPLMLAARGGHAKLCELLISFGAKCDVENDKRETAHSLARNKNDVVQVIKDGLARELVLSGARVKKHTKCGKGSPHSKVLRMVGAVGVLRWGKSNRRNVICKGGDVGPSETFRWNRRRRFDTDEPGLFHVVTTKNKEVHFVCEGGVEMAELWVRGIKLVTREAIFGKNRLL